MASINPSGGPSPVSPSGPQGIDFDQRLEGLKKYMDALYPQLTDNPQLKDQVDQALKELTGLLNNPQVPRNLGDVLVSLQSNLKAYQDASQGIQEDCKKLGIS